ncbi:hypothetical protein LXL04_001343 [Taraxacum kok-saghyz]
MNAGSSSSLELPQQFRQFIISKIHSATRNFDESLVIGHGGFGMVYKGTITSGETQFIAAIKRLDSTSNQGAVEFWNEVQMLSKLRHCHLVSLIGYCNDAPEIILYYLEVLTGKQAVDRSLDEEHWGLVNWAQESFKEGDIRMLRRFESKTINTAAENFSDHNIIDGGFFHYSMCKLEHENLLQLLGYSIKGRQVSLVYEFAVYASLDDLLIECTLLDWNKRSKIILAIARVLVYLHQHHVIHNSLVPRRVLLNESLLPKLSDMVQASYNEGDKYRNWMDKRKDLQDVWRNWFEGKCSNIIRRGLHVESSSITRIIHIGLLCVQTDAADRPTMKEVVSMLTNFIAHSPYTQKTYAITERKR